MPPQKPLGSTMSNHVPTRSNAPTFVYMTALSFNTSHISYLLRVFIKSPNNKFVFKVTEKQFSANLCCKGKLTQALFILTVKFGHK